MRRVLRNCLLSLFVSAMVLGCGSKKSKENDGKVVDSSEEGQIQFSGFVGGAFAITVDGRRYEDSESFFTEEQESLKTKVRAAGYDESWSAAFDAAVGFSDLQKNMRVYISAKEERGYQGETVPAPDGSFSITLPDNAKGSEYEVRAVKRVNVVLTAADAVKQICYNFSAVAKSVYLSERDKPILLRDFETRLTAYACNEGGRDGLRIPTVPSEGRVNAGDGLSGGVGVPISKGMSAAGVVAAWGEPSRVAALSTNELVWFYGTESPLPSLAVCRLTFLAGVLSAADGCNPKSLDLLAFMQEAAVGTALAPQVGDQRIHKGYSASTVVGLWGTPRLMRTTDGVRQQLFYGELHATSSSFDCVLSFERGLVVSFGSGCALSGIAHWGF